MVYQLIHGKTPAEEAASLADHLIDVDGDFDKVTIADLTPDGGKSISNNKLTAGRVLRPDHIPTQVKRQRPLDCPLADYMPAPKGAAYVSPAFKALVEQFEPGVHQFFEMSAKSGKNDLGTVYYFVVANRIDALDHDACVPPIGPNDKIYKPTYGPDDKRVFNTSQIGGAHIWSEKHELGLFMSDAFHDAIFENGLTGVKDSTRYEETGS